MEMDLPDLAPGTFYHVQARSVVGDRTSGWSPIFQFLSSRDLTPPPIPENVTAVPAGDAFNVTWTRPSGDTMVDFSHYEVEASVNAATAVFAVPAETFAFTRTDNIAVFGTPQGVVNFRVRSLDLSGNASDWSASVTGSNPAPSKVEGVTATPMVNGFTVNWTMLEAVGDNQDIVAYNVYVHSGSAPTVSTTGALAGSVFGASIVYTTLSYDIPHYFAVRAVDSFGLESTEVTWFNAGSPVNPSEADIDPPPAPTAVTATSVDTGLRVTWTAPNEADGSPNTAVGYRIRYKLQSDSEWNYQDAPAVGYAQINDLTPGSTYDVEVQAYDSSFNFSAFVATTGTPAVDSTVLPAPDVAGYATPTQISLSWRDVNGAADYQVEASVNSNFSSPINLGGFGTTTIPFASIAGLTAGTLYYVRVRARNRSRTPGTWTTLQVTPPASGQTPFGTPFLSGSLLVANTLAGDRVIANSLSAETLKAGTAITQNLTVANTLTMGTVGSTSGIIQSANYNVTNKTGYRLMHNSLEILDGSIDGKVIRTGEIRSTATVNVDGTGQPQWSLNTAGGMQINSAVVRGSMVLGSSGTANSGQIQSWDYAAGTTGWAIKGNGTVDFKSGNFRGDITGATGTFSGSLNVNNKFFVDSSGNIGIGGTAATNGAFRVSSTGQLTATNAVISGDISGMTGTFGGTVSGAVTGTTYGPINIGSSRFMVDSSGNIGIGYGSYATDANNYFRVTSDGTLYASSGSFTGNINSGSSISGSSIYGSNFYASVGTMEVTMGTLTSGSNVSDRPALMFRPSGSNYLGRNTRIISGLTNSAAMTLYSGSHINSSSPYETFLQLTNDSASWAFLGGYSTRINLNYNGVFITNGLTVDGNRVLTTADQTGGHTHSGWTLLDANNYTSYAATSGHTHTASGSVSADTHSHTISGTSHSHTTSQLSGTITTGQPNWTGSGVNAYDTGGGRGTSISSHVHTSTSHTHTLTL